MKVGFLTFDDKLASARYRVSIPMRELAKLGFEIGPDGETIVCSKHGWDPAILDGYRCVVYDVCDDHFEDRHADFYRDMVRRADVVTCNSAAMQWRIWEKAGVSARVIPDPYELDERAPSWGQGLLWFGHESNLPDLSREAVKLDGYDLRIVSTPLAAGITAWSPEVLVEALDRCAVVIIPTGKSPYKSANRLVEAVRRGKFVVANPLPAYEEFSGLAWIGDIREGVDHAHAHAPECLDRVAKCQAYVRQKFSPERIGKLWAAVLMSLGEGKKRGLRAQPPTP